MLRRLDGSLYEAAAQLKKKRATKKVDNELG